MRIDDGLALTATNRHQPDASRQVNEQASTQPCKRGRTLTNPLFCPRADILLESIDTMSRTGGANQRPLLWLPISGAILPGTLGRSEERRVGKEWRCGWST